MEAHAARVSFATRVWRFVRTIPRGRVATYGQIAQQLGRPRGARSVGQAMRECPADLPWHRVVNAAGGISRRARMSGMLTQRLRLQAEGVTLRGGRVPLRHYRWTGVGVVRAAAAPGRGER
ncbi:MAG: methyltransferase [Candidatus Rokuibacteriota bacterium]|nr:MAG: methyltransferase [Candidatus Rokubacteria bacterium]